MPIWPCGIKCSVMEWNRGGSPVSALATTPGERTEDAPQLSRTTESSVETARYARLVSCPLRTSLRGVRLKAYRQRSSTYQEPNHANIARSLMLLLVVFPSVAVFRPTASYVGKPSEEEKTVQIVFIRR